MELTHVELQYSKNWVGNLSLVVWLSTFATTQLKSCNPYFLIKSGNICNGNLGANYLSSHQYFCLCGKHVLIVSYISEFICYDDGCYLKKYSCNPNRANQTSTARL